MKRFALCLVAVVMLLFVAQFADAQVVRRYYRPMVVAPAVPVVRVYHPPTVVYQPTTVTYARRRPILGGYAVRTRPGVQQAVVW